MVTEHRAVLTRFVQHRCVLALRGDTWGTGAHPASSLPCPTVAREVAGANKNQRKKKETESQRCGITTLMKL